MRVKFDNERELKIAFYAVSDMGEDYVDFDPWTDDAPQFSYTEIKKFASHLRGQQALEQEFDEKEVKILVAGLNLWLKENKDNKVAFSLGEKLLKKLSVPGLHEVFGIAEGFDTIAVKRDFLTIEERAWLAGMIMAREFNRKDNADPWDDAANDHDNHPEKKAYDIVTRGGRVDWRRNLEIGTTLTIQQVKNLIDVCEWYAGATSGRPQAAARAIASKFSVALEGHADAS